MMEGGRIDHACHENNRERMVHEVLEFSRAVQEVYDWAADRGYADYCHSNHETGRLAATADRGVGLSRCDFGRHEDIPENVPIYAQGAGVEKIVLPPVTPRIIPIFINC